MSVVEGKERDNQSEDRKNQGSSSPCSEGIMVVSASCCPLWQSFLMKPTQLSKHSPCESLWGSCHQWQLLLHCSVLLIPFLTKWHIYKGNTSKVCVFGCVIKSTLALSWKDILLFVFEDVSADFPSLHSQKSHTHPALLHTWMDSRGACTHANALSHSPLCRKHTRLLSKTTMMHSLTAGC